MSNRRISRRRVLAAGVSGVAGLAALDLIRPQRALAQTSPGTVVYVSNAGSKDVYALAMNRDSGKLDLIEKVPVPGSDKPSPQSLPMATSPDKRYLYAQLRGEPYPVSTFAIDPVSGRLRHVGATPLIDQMAYINVDRSGRYLLAASYVGGKLAIYPINAQRVVQGSPIQIVDNNPKAHCVVVDASNQNVYVPVLELDVVLELKFDAATGTVKPNGNGRIATRPKAGPRHLTIHPGGKFAYLLTETTATIGAYSIDSGSGRLTELQFVQTNEYAEQPSASDIHVTPNGRFLYAAERRSSLLIGYKIDSDKGTLAPLGRFPTEKTPRGFAIDPRGRFVLSVGMTSNGMTVHSIDQVTGELKPVDQYPMGIQPNWIEIVDLK
jgi:6-phosphogluconolactonase